MSDDLIESQSAHDRRRFFRVGLARVLRPAADFLERRLPLALPVVRARLRPPGALPEDRFLDTCFRCGACADGCPADAISLIDSDDQRLHGTPYIDPSNRACVICEDLTCMKGCPSGALQLVDRLAIRIGLARVDHDVCVRSKGQECTICIERCPIGPSAIRLDADGRVQVVDPRGTALGCTGCGVCEEQCPTRPVRAIRVIASDVD